MCAGAADGGGTAGGVRTQGKVQLHIVIGVRMDCFQLLLLISLQTENRMRQNLHIGCLFKVENIMNSTIDVLCRFNSTEVRAANCLLCRIIV